MPAKKEGDGAVTSTQMEVEHKLFLNIKLWYRSRKSSKPPVL